MSTRFRFSDIVDEEDFDENLREFQESYFVAKSSVAVALKLINVVSDNGSADEDPK